MRRRHGAASRLRCAASSRSRTIRVVPALLTTVLLATGLGLGGYCVLIALRREPGPGLPPVDRAPPQHLAPPAPLAADADFVQSTLAPIPPAPTPATVAITVRVQNLPAAWRTDDAGLAIHRPRLESGLHWLALRDAAAEGDELRFRYTLPERGPHCFAIAAARTDALHGYLVRHTAEVAPTAEIAIDATAAAVEFTAATSRARSVPWRLSRADDPTWLPLHASAGLAFANDAPLRVWLGAGSYALDDPLARARRQTFDVPATQRVVVSCEPAAPADPPR